MNIENSPPPTFSDLLQKTLHCSRYAKRVLEIDPALLDWLQNNHTTPFDRAEMQALLQMLDPCDETELARVVRQLRKLVMVRLILRDLNGLADLIRSDAYDHRAGRSLRAARAGLSDASHAAAIRQPDR